MMINIASSPLAILAAALTLMLLLLWFTARRLNQRLNRAIAELRKGLGLQTTRLARSEPLWERLFTFEHQVHHAAGRIQALHRCQHEHEEQIARLEAELQALKAKQAELPEGDASRTLLQQAREKLELKQVGLIHQQKQDAADLEAILQEYAHGDTVVQQLQADINAKKLWLGDDAATAMQLYAQALAEWLDEIMQERRDMAVKAYAQLERRREALAEHRETLLTAEDTPAIQN